MGRRHKNCWRLLAKSVTVDFLLSSITSVLRNRIPKFLYFDEYYQMKGKENFDALRQRMEQNTLEPIQITHGIGAT